jgi:hypothetical protein
MFILLAGLLIAFSVAYYMNEKRKIRNEQLHLHKMEKFEELMNTLKRVKSDKDDEVTDPENIGEGTTEAK